VQKLATRFLFYCGNEHHAALHKNSHHESTKGRKHEKEFHSMRISFVISFFRAFVIGLEGGAGPVFVQSHIMPQ
jgi:hypothetical protein